MRREISVFLVVYSVNVAINGILATGSILDRQLERMMKDEKQMNGVIRTFSGAKTKGTMPESVTVIKQLRWCLIPDRKQNYGCDKSNIQKISDFNSFMMDNSERYRNFDYEFAVARSIINCHWNYMIKCFNVRLGEFEMNLPNIDLRRLADHLAEFWTITSSNKDVYYLSIVSELLSGRRKIRNALENPRDWAKMIESLLKKDYIINEQLSEEDALEKIQKTLRQSTVVESLTGLRYPTQGFIEELYERLILQRCKSLQNNELLVHYANEATILARISIWPEKGMEKRNLFRLAFRESVLGPLTMGLLVCKEFAMNERLKDLAVERGGAIVRFLTESHLGSDNDEEVPFGFHELYLISSLETFQSLSDVFQNSQEYLDKEPYEGMRWILNLMYKLRRITEVEPSSFTCDNEEIANIGDLFLSLSKPISLFNLLNLNRLMNELRDQFAKECIYRSIRYLELHADKETIIAAVRMPRFWSIIEQNRGDDERISLRLWLSYAGSLYDGRKRLLDRSDGHEKWRILMQQSLIDASNVQILGVPQYIPSCLKQYWGHADEPRFISRYKELGWPTKVDNDSIYRKVVLDWCRIFDYPPTPVFSEFIIEIIKSVKIASIILRPEYDFATIDSGELQAGEFLLAQLALGYSTCLTLDRAAYIMGKVTIPRVEIGVA